MDILRRLGVLRIERAGITTVSGFLLLCDQFAATDHVALTQASSKLSDLNVASSNQTVF